MPKIKSMSNIMMFVSLIGCLMVEPQLAWAAPFKETFVGKAYAKDKLIYTETHEAQFEDGKVLRAQTVYKDPSGKKIAEMSSDFSKNPTAPAHDFKDFRFNYEYGIRYQDQKPVMYSKEKDGSEKIKLVDQSRQDQLLVGCQGLGYYFRTNLSEVKSTPMTSILYIIPGRLDTYNFEMVYKNKAANGLDIFEVHIRNWFLRLFAPKLILHYDSNKNRLVKYEGLSNLVDEKENTQSVTIHYEWL